VADIFTSKFKPIEFVDLEDSWGFNYREKVCILATYFKRFSSECPGWPYGNSSNFRWENESVAFDWMYGKYP